MYLNCYFWALNNDRLNPIKNCRITRERVSVKRGVGAGVGTIFFLLKNLWFGLGLTLTLTLNNPNLPLNLTLKQHSLKKRYSPTPAPTARFTDTPRELRTHVEVNPNRISLLICR